MPAELKWRSLNGEMVLHCLVGDAKYLVRLGLAPMARRTMPSMALMVLDDILTASPLIVWTAAMPLRALSDVRNTRTRGGRDGRGGGIEATLAKGVLLPDPAAFAE